MSPRTLTVVSLFSGAGGLDIGLEQAGLRVVTAVDCDADCLATLRLNQESRTPAGDGRSYLAEARIISSKIEEVEAGELRPKGCGRSWTPDVLAGGPPCQPFSSSGKLLSV